MNTEIFEKKSLILIRVDFDKNQKPRLKFADQATKEIINFTPKYGQNITIKIDTNQRFCIGWHDLETGEDHVCPEETMVEPKYEQCPRCQKKTGFNPAFYNAAEGDISKQQQIRNSQPHFVYLAHFSEGIVKVGISFCGRDITRLLEQGARSALILGDFPSANIARSYEAKISAMPGIYENIKSNAKIKFLEKKYEQKQAKDELLKTRAKIESNLNIKLEENSVIYFDDRYCEEKIPSGEFISVANNTKGNELIFSGTLIAQVGYILIAQQQDENLILPIRKFTGYKIELSPKTTKIELPERQASLFDF